MKKHLFEQVSWQGCAIALLLLPAIPLYDGNMFDLEYDKAFYIHIGILGAFYVFYMMTKSDYKIEKQRDLEK